MFSGNGDHVMLLCVNSRQDRYISKKVNFLKMVNYDMLANKTKWYKLDRAMPIIVHTSFVCIVNVSRKYYPQFY